MNFFNSKERGFSLADSGKKDKTAGNAYIYILIFLLTLVATYLSMPYQTKIKATSTMDIATMPLVWTLSPEDKKYNQMIGYVDPIDAKGYEGNVSMIPQDRKLRLYVESYGAELEAVNYKIRDKESRELIENTELKDFEETLGGYNLNLEIKNLIEDGKDYLLELNLKTDKRDESCFYAIIKKGQDSDIDAAFNFASDFASYTYDDSKLSNIASYIETDGTQDNTDFSSVNIKNTQTQIGWGNLDTKIEGEIAYNLISASPEVCEVGLTYRISLIDEEDKLSSLNVYEYYRLRNSGSKIYLLNYSRKASQIFDASNAVTKTGNINLGITYDKDVSLAANADNTELVFENEGNLWLYSQKDKTFTQVFTFESEGSDNKRERLKQHDYKIVSVSDDGDVVFAVYGYMNRGKHEGKVGISLYSYSNKAAYVDELVFIPIDSTPWKVMANTCSLAYLKDRLFYCMIDGTLYAIDIDSKEVMTEVTDLKRQDYVVADNGRIIAYVEPDDMKKIKIFNMEKGTSYEIKADDGDKVKALAFIQTDFIYGIAHEDDILVDELSNQVFPMYSINILNENYENIKNYEQDGIYVTDTEVDGLRFNMSRVTKSGDTYTSTSIDQLINKDENDKKAVAYLTSTFSSLKETELIIVLPQAIEDASAIKISRANAVRFNDDKIPDIAKEIKESNLYYVYGNGRFVAAYIELEKAIISAADNNGYVIDADGKLAYHSVKPSSAQASEISMAGDIGDSINSADAKVAANSAKRITISGSNVSMILWYVSEGKPLIGKTLDGYAQVLAYDSNNVTYIDSKGVKKTDSMKNVSKYFSQGGNTFVTYY